MQRSEDASLVTCSRYWNWNWRSHPSLESAKRHDQAWRKRPGILASSWIHAVVHAPGAQCGGGMTALPVLDRGNSAVQQLHAWLRRERDTCRGILETETDTTVILRTQGRAQLLRELEMSIDPNIKGYGT